MIFSNIASISSLEKDLKFNKSILKELKSVVKNNTDNIDIRQFISIYISCIGNIQKRIREIIHYDSQKWEQILTNLINKYQNSMVENEPVSSVFVISVDENDQKVEEYPIFQEFMEVRKMLELKNNIFANLEKRFISNIIKDNDP